MQISSEIINTMAPDKANLLGTANTNWQDLIFRNTASFDSNLSLMGNLFDKIPSRLSIGHTENEGLLLTSNYKRSTASFTLNPTLFDNHLKLNISGNYTYAFRTNADEGAIGSAISYDPTQSPYDAQTPFAGYREWYQQDGAKYFFRGTSNPLSQLLERRNIGNHHRFYGNINVDYKFHFLPELRLIVNAGIDKQKVMVKQKSVLLQEQVIGMVCL
jgi:iron complex outermembrane receptor protein